MGHDEFSEDDEDPERIAQIVARPADGETEPPAGAATVGDVSGLRVEDNTFTRCTPPPCPPVEPVTVVACVNHCAECGAHLDGEYRCPFGHTAADPYEGIDTLLGVPATDHYRQGTEVGRVASDDPILALTRDAAPTEQAGAADDEPGEG